MKPKILTRIYKSSTFFEEIKSREDLVIDQRDISGVGDRNFADLLSEYQGIILDTPDNAISHNSQRKAQFINYINNSNGFIICILRKFKGAWAHNSSYAFVDTIMEETLGVAYSSFKSNESGSSGEVTNFSNNTVFNDYLRTPGVEWFISLNKESTENALPLMNNVESDAIAFMSKKYSNRIFFLPWIADAEEFFWKAVLELAKELSGYTENSPQWVEKYQIPTMKEKNVAIANLQKNIDEAEKKKKSIVEENNKLIDIRDTLLFRDGIKLQNTVKNILNDLGIPAKDGKMGREDIIFELGDKPFVSEVKGLKKSAAERHLNQLHSKKGQYEFELKKKTKGVLIVNAWREFPIEERGGNDHQIFPDQINKVTEMWEFALLTTQQLFVAYCNNLEGKFDKENFINDLFKTVGVFSGLDDIDEYKLKGEN